MATKQDILKFNLDKGVIELKEKQSKPSFFEIISKERSETSYSAFLNWLLTDSNWKANGYKPLLLFLNVLANKGGSNIDKALLDDIILDNIEIKDVDGVNEKSVKDFGIEPNTKDSLDLFVECKCQNQKEFQIILENKIDSHEEAPKKVGASGYNGMYQTKRYYYATHIQGKIALYVYLTPQNSKEAPRDSHFIKITYQDILEYVIIPLLSFDNIPASSVMYLEQFKNELIFPNQEHESIASDDSTMQKIEALWTRHKDLFVDAMLAKYKNKHPKTKVFKDNTGQVYKRFKPSTSSVVEMYPKGIAPQSNDYVLVNFWNKNYKLIDSIFKAADDSEKDKVSDFIDISYNLLYDGSLIKSVNSNIDLVCEVIRLWVSKIKGGNASLKEIQTAFPSGINSYYNNRQIIYLKNIIAKVSNGTFKAGNDILKEQYDIQNGFDPVKPTKYDISTTNGDAIVMMKWGRKEIMKFIEHSKKEFGNKLDVEIIYGNFNIQ